MTSFFMNEIKKDKNEIVLIQSCCEEMNIKKSSSIDNHKVLHKQKEKSQVFCTVCNLRSFTTYCGLNIKETLRF